MKKISKFFVISILTVSVFSVGAHAAETLCTKACRLKYEECQAAGGGVSECADAYIDCLYNCSAP